MNEKQDEKTIGSKIFRVYLSKDEASIYVHIFGDGYTIVDGVLGVFVRNGEARNTIATFYHWCGIVEVSNLAKSRDLKALE